MATTAPSTQPLPRGLKTETGPARFIAEPAALGLAAFALSTMVLSFINVGILDQDTLPVGGGFGIATAACAWYASFALTANMTTRRDWIPVGGRRSAQQDAPPPDMSPQEERRFDVGSARSSGRRPGA